MTFENALQLAKSRSDCEARYIDKLVELVRSVGDVSGEIVECGSYKCGATIALAAADPNKKVYALDTFGGLPYGESQQGFENFANTDFYEIVYTTSEFPNIRLIQGRHEETVPRLAPLIGPVSFLFMDSDFYSSHQVCLTTFWPQISPKGIIVFHDWTFSSVQQAIHETIQPTECSVIEQLPNSMMGWVVKK